MTQTLNDRAGETAPEAITVQLSACCRGLPGDLCGCPPGTRAEDLDALRADPTWPAWLASMTRTTGTVRL